MLAVSDTSHRSACTATPTRVCVWRTMLFDETYAAWTVPPAPATYTLHHPHQSMCVSTQEEDQPASPTQLDLQPLTVLDQSSPGSISRGESSPLRK